MFLFLSLSLSLSVFDMSFCVYFCMFPVCPLCCFIVISMDLVSKINDDDDDDTVGVCACLLVCRQRNLETDISQTLYSDI